MYTKEKDNASNLNWILFKFKVNALHLIQKQNDYHRQNLQAK